MLAVMATTTLPDIGRAARWFHALSDATRLEIVGLLSHGERCVCELQGALQAAQSRLSFHLKTLKDAGLVSDRRRPLGLLRLEPRRARRDRRVCRGREARQARRQLRPGVLQPMSGEEIKDTVQAKYGQAATRVLGRGQGGNCGCDPVSLNLYDAAETA